MSNDDPLLPASRMETGLPRAPGPHRQPLNNLRDPTPSVCLLQVITLHALSGSHFFFSKPCILFHPYNYCLFLCYSNSLNFYHPPPSLFYYVLLCVLCPFSSIPPFLFASLLPSSLCPTVQVRRGSVRRFLSGL